LDGKAKAVYEHLVEIVFDRVKLKENGEPNLEQAVAQQITCDLARTNTT
jgi:hypothetical protein